MDFGNFIMEETNKNYISKLVDHNLKLLLVGENETGKTSLIKKIRNYISTRSNIKILTIKNYNDVSISYFRNEVRQFCQINKNIKKIIIIDDIDYIKESSQHILCCLMNKYENIQYILSCKNVRKVNDNIINKCISIRLNILNKEQLLLLLEQFAIKYNLKMCNQSKLYIVDNCDMCPLLIKNNLKCLFIYDSNITIDIVKEICTKNQDTNYKKYFELLRQHKITEARGVLIDINNACISLIDMFDILYNYVKKCNNIFNDTEKFNIIKIISSYKIILNIHHEKEIELNFITSDIYYELQKNI